MYKNNMNNYHHSTGYIPKLHKNLKVLYRFIVASNKCTTKQLSSLLTSCFKTILTHYNNHYCDGIYNYILELIATTTILLKYWTVTSN